MLDARKKIEQQQERCNHRGHIEDNGGKKTGILQVTKETLRIADNR